MERPGGWAGSAQNPLAPNYVDDQNPTTVTGSYITVSHAVKREGALNCVDCHVNNGPLNFAELGYLD